MSDMVSSKELGIEVEILSHESNPDPPVPPESQPPSSQKTNFKGYEKEKTVETCAPTKEAGKDDIIFSGNIEIISKEQFVLNIPQTIQRLEKIQKNSKIPDYVALKLAAHNIWAGVEVGESLPEGSQVIIGVPGKSLGRIQNINATKKTNKKCHIFEATKDFQDQGDYMMNVEVDHIDNEPLHPESSPYSMKQSLIKPLCLSSKYSRISRKGEN
ncbi:hypothetical protein O181_036561 [Austropuccinia psidii MF-1]|uniref:Uncharacterized protein n=1 Tax=Austropuccinia psidii MF-1 TaxID=1389203 RepID=A0A9Q3D4N2_9BASI|nr:hypothetical protein [Austropuccinia psidii MF-1]